MMRCLLLASAVCLHSLILPIRAGQDEPKDGFRKWLDEDVVYIITPEERAVFAKLTQEAEKEAFIEQFWKRRDSDPSSAENEFKIEHYRRIAYANENFKSGVDGWVTDRGRVYITFGPPDNVEAYPSGRTYERPAQEGGGRTTTFPYEVWHYRHIAGVGSGLDLEFVDANGTGQYRLALRPEEKDALLMIPGAGETVLERMGLATRAGRIRSMDLMRPSGLEGDLFTQTGNPLLRIEQFLKLQQPVQIRYTDLRTAVEARVVYSDLPFGLRVDSFRGARDWSLVPVTAFFDHAQLGAGQGRARVSVYGRVESLAREIVAEFEEEIAAPLTPGRPGYSLFQKPLALKPGRYKLTVIAKDLESGRMGSRSEALEIAPAGPSLEVSDLVLADSIFSERDVTLPEAFVVPAGLKVYPSRQSVFERGQPIGLYFEVYGAALDASTGRPLLRVQYFLIRDSKESAAPTGGSAPVSRLLADRVCLAQRLEGGEMEAGMYQLRVAVQDQIAGVTAEKIVPLEIRAGYSQR